MLNNKIFRNVLILITGAGSAQIINLSFSPILTRLYGPEAYGLLGMFMALIMTITPVTTLCYDLAVVLPKSTSKAASIALNTLLISLILLIFSLFIIWFFFEYFEKIMPSYFNKYLLYLLPPLIGIIAVQQVSQRWLQRLEEYKKIAAIDVFQAAFLNIIRCFFGVFYALPLTLVIITCFGLFTRSFQLFRSAYCLGLDKIVESRLSSKLYLEYKDFPLYRTPQLILNAFSRNLPVLIMGSFFSSNYVGMMVLAQTVITAPVNLLGNAINNVFYSNLTKKINDNESVKKELVLASVYLLTISLFLFLPILFFGEEVFSYIFGNEWQFSGQIASWLGLSAAMILLSRPYVSVIPVLGLQKHFLFFELFCTTLKICGLLFGFTVLNNPLSGIAIFSIANVISYIILSVYIYIKCN